MKQKIPTTKIMVAKVSFGTYKQFEESCKNEGKNINKKLNEMIDRELEGQKGYFLAGKNKFVYDKTIDKFSWVVELDRGEKKEVLSNLSLEFLKNIKEEIEKSFVERENWIQGSKKGSPAIPGRLVD